MAVFSTSGPGGAIWPEATRSLHAPQERNDVRGRSKTIDDIAAELREIRGSGGRFFITKKGADYQEEGGPLERFVQFEFVTAPSK